MTLDPATKRLKARAQRALGSQRVADAVVKVRAIVGPFEIPDQEPLAQKALDKMHDGEQPTAEEMTALEIVVRLLRPVVFSHNGELDDLPTPPAGHKSLYSPELTSRWKTFRDGVTPVVPSIGRVELKDGTHIGTGFVVSKDRLVTNRHVLDVITRGSERLSPGSARVVFRQEDKATNAAADLVWITGVVAIHPTLDMVILELPTGGRSAVSLETKAVAEGADVVVIGFPAEDRVNNPVFLSTVFQGAYGKKRASLGEVLDGTKSPTLFHDCSTTQGNSGSPVFSLQSARVVGIHRAGFFMYRNEAVAAGALGQFIKPHIH